MFKQAMAFACLLTTTLLAVQAASHTVSTSISISAHVDPFAEWADSNTVVLETDWSGPINKVNQNRTIAKSLILYTNTDAVITAKPGLNNGILTSGAQSLKTAFMITGGVSSPDSSFKDAAEFFSPRNTYNVVHRPGTGDYTVTLTTQASSPADSAPDQGTYTCGVILTAEW